MLDLIDCDRYPGHLRLTRAACAQQWRQAQTHALDGQHRLWPCVQCPLGAALVGQSSITPRVDLGIQRLCPRCQRHAMKVVKGVCVSCYNREREARLGKDRRGHRPHFPAPTPMMVQVIRAEVSVVRRKAALSLPELMIACLKEQPDIRAFARAPTSPLGACACGR